MRLFLILCVLMCGRAIGATPVLKPFNAIIDRYPLTNYPGGSNAIIILYKSTRLGTVWSPWKPTSVFPATRTNQFIQVVSGNTYRFYCVCSIEPYGVSLPSNTNMITVP